MTASLKIVFGLLPSVKAISKTIISLPSESLEFSISSDALKEGGSFFPTTLILKVSGLTLDLLSLPDESKSVTLIFIIL